MTIYPMTTAPMDGTRFRGLCGEDLIAMCWHPDFEAFVSSWRQITMAKGYLIDGMQTHDHSPVIHEPTGWQPLDELTLDNST